MTERHVTLRRRPEAPPRRRSLRRRIGIAAIVAFAIVLIFVGVLWSRLAAFNDRVSERAAASSALFGPLTFGDEPINLLVLGYGGPGHEGAYLTDSINILSIEPSSDTTTIIPIPRDLWIEGRPEIPANGKINQAFALGYESGGVADGARLATAVTSGVTGVEIDHWMTLDFKGLEAAVDAVGGITVENPTSFSYGSPEDAAAGSGWDGTFDAGALSLDGSAALLYARTRYTSDPAQSNDFARSERQQRVLQALVREVAGEGLGSLGSALSLMDAVDDHLQTDLSVIDLGLLAGHLEPDRRIELAEGIVLEATTTTDGQYVLVPIERADPTDYTHIEEYIAEELSQPVPSARPTANPDAGE